MSDKPKELDEKTIAEFAKAYEKSTRKSRAPRKLIFLSGFANTGKDTVFKLIEKVSTEPVLRVSFADALKTECYPTLGGGEYAGPENEDREWKDANRSGIIQYGESKKHEEGMYYWLKRALHPVMMKDYDREMDLPHIVVTDARRTEEIMWLKHYKLNHFAELFKARLNWEPIMFVVHREGAESDKDYLTHIALEYAAETRVFTSMIKNYGTIDQLEQKIKDLYVRYIR